MMVQEKLKITKINITDIKPADYNPRLITDNELNKLRNSINEFDLVDPIIINLKNNKIIGGHQRYEVLLDNYMNEGFKNPDLQLIKLGDIGWVFTNSDLKIKDDDYEKALNIALNKINGEWDYGKLGELIRELNNNSFDLDLTGFDEIELDDLNINSLEPIIDVDLNSNEDNIDYETYTQTINIPQYEITGVKPKINELIDTTKYDELIKKIEDSNVSEEEKQFLKIASQRHVVFNYDKIAEFYAHQDKEVQELMEENALVIIDLENAIANGYVKLDKYIKKMRTMQNE